MNKTNEIITRAKLHGYGFKPDQWGNMIKWTPSQSVWVAFTLSGDFDRCYIDDVETDIKKTGELINALYLEKLS